MTKYIYENKKGDNVIEITVNEDRGTFRYSGLGSFGAGCGDGGLEEAKKSIFSGMSQRKINTVSLVK